MRHIPSALHLIFLIMIALGTLVRQDVLCARAIGFRPISPLGAVVLSLRLLHHPSEAGALGAELVFGGFFLGASRGGRDRAA